MTTEPDYSTMQTDMGASVLRGEPRKSLVQAILAYIVFCGLSALSRLVPILFLLMVIIGIAFPLVWAKVHGDWESIGFTRRKRVQAFVWGFGAGLIGVLYIILSSRSQPYPEPALFALQLAIGVFLAFLILSPFQEFFFRGWLQPRFEKALGKWWGLLVTAVSFTAWHFCPPFEGTPTSSIPVTSVSGALTTLVMGLVFGYIFRRTGNILAPWLAHALMIIGLVVVGAMSFVQYSP